MLRLSLIFVVLCGSVLAFPSGTKNENRIVGGFEDNIENIPWQISLQFNAQHVCGGSILNANTILTAAHCVDWTTNLAAFAIRAGSSDGRGGGQFIHALSITMHELYDDSTLFYDIAIIKLQANLVFGPGVQLINLPPQGFYVPAPTPVQLSGWGALVFQGPSPDIVQTVTKPIFSMPDCQAAYGANNVDAIMQICSGEEGRDACQGDSGGGLIYAGYVIGIVSWGSGCAWEGYPTVYARVSEFRSWIVPQMYP